MDRSVDVAIIGAGQAGLATSWYLSQANVDHVVLDAGRVAETWRTRRWDSFCLVTPNWTVRLPGGKYAGADPDGYMPLAELVAHFDSWARSFKAPIEANTQVTRLGAQRDGFVLSLPSGTLKSRRVVVATGAFQSNHRPAGAEFIDPSVQQIFSDGYSNPASLPPGGVLIVGSGQTGCQLAEELHEAGRKVFISCGRSPWAPRRAGGRDILWWMIHSRFLDRSPDKLPSPAARLLANPATTGHGGGRDLHVRTLHKLGIELLGRFADADGRKLRFADDLAASSDFGDARLADLWQYIDAYCATRGMAPPPLELPPALRVRTRTKLDLSVEGITSVIWTSGYRPDYGWVEFPVLDDMGFPVQTDGRTKVPGLYFMGAHWMRKAKSSILYGVGEDAEIVARHIVEERA
jgi:putative flavoprotein involved in K+ transport